MRATLGSASEFNAAITASGSARSNTGGGGVVSKYMMSGGGRGRGTVSNKYGTSGRRGFGSRLFGSKKRASPVVVEGNGAAKSASSGNESAPETDDDSAKIEAVWKQRLEIKTKNAINQLQSQHAEEISARQEKVQTLSETVCSRFLSLKMVEMLRFSKNAEIF